jgi:hypothetical protein
VWRDTDLLDQVVGRADAILGAGLADLDKLGPCDCRATPTVKAQFARKSVERRGASTWHPLRMFRARDQSCLPAVRRVEAPGCSSPHTSTTSQEDISWLQIAVNYDWVALRCTAQPNHDARSMLCLPSTTDRHEQARIPPRQAAGSCRGVRAPLQGPPTVLERLRRHMQAAQHGEHDKAFGRQHVVAFQRRVRGVCGALGARAQAAGAGQDRRGQGEEQKDGEQWGRGGRARGGVRGRGPRGRGRRRRGGGDARRDAAPVCG